MYYNEKQYISSPIGNNALSYEQRKLLGSDCILAIPMLKTGTFSDIKKGTEIVFEEVDHKNNIHTCTGLENLLEIPITRNGEFVIHNCFVMDNHNHALYFRYREYLSKRLGAGATLIHIDQHADMGIPLTQIDTAKCNDIDYISSYTNEACNVGNFIQPAIDSLLLTDVIQVRSVSKLLEMQNSEFRIQNYILDIDIDFRVDHSPTKDEIAAIHQLYQGAKLCTIALSPYFMPIEKSIQVTKLLFGN